MAKTPSNLVHFRTKPICRECHSLTSGQRRAFLNSLIARKGKMPGKTPRPCLHGVPYKSCRSCSRCRHGNDRYRCRKCGVGYCVHGRDKYRCRDCGTGYCEHKRLTAFCLLCSTNICPHDLPPYVCEFCSRKAGDNVEEPPRGTGPICRHGERVSANAAASLQPKQKRTAKGTGVSTGTSSTVVGNANWDSARTAGEGATATSAAP